MHRLLILLAVAALLNCACLAADTAKKPVVLQGRIEEIVAPGGANLPVRLRAMKGQFDTSGTASASASASGARLHGSATGMAAGAAASSSYPTDWRGLWGGALKVHSAEFFPSRWKDDPEQTAQE